MLMFILLYGFILSGSCYILKLKKEQIKEDIRTLKQYKDIYYRTDNKADKRIKEYVLMHQWSASCSGSKELIDFVNEILKKYYNIKQFVKLKKKKNIFIELLDIQRFIIFFIIIGLPIMFVGYSLDFLKFIAKYLIRSLTFIIIKLTKLIRYVKHF